MLQMVDWSGLTEYALLRIFDFLNARQLEAVGLVCRR